MEQINKIEMKIEKVIEEMLLSNDYGKDREKILVRSFVMRLMNKSKNDKLNERMKRMFNDEIELKLSVGAYRNKCGLNVNKCMKIIEEIDSILSNGDEKIAQERKKIFRKAQSLLNVADRIFNKSNKLIDFINKLVSSTPVNNNNNNNNNGSNGNNSIHNINRNDSTESNKDEHHQESKDMEIINQISETSYDNEENYQMRNEIKGSKKRRADDRQEKIVEKKQKVQKKHAKKSPKAEIIEGSEDVRIEIELPPKFDVESDLQFSIDEQNPNVLKIIGFDKPLIFSVDSKVADIDRAKYKVINTSSDLSSKKILRLTIPFKRKPNKSPPAAKIPQTKAKANSPGFLSCLFPFQRCVF